MLKSCPLRSFTWDTSCALPSPGLSFCPTLELLCLSRVDSESINQFPSITFSHLHTLEMTNSPSIWEMSWIERCDFPSHTSVAIDVYRSPQFLSRIWHKVLLFLQLRWVHSYYQTLSYLNADGVASYVALCTSLQDLVTDCKGIANLATAQPHPSFSRPSFGVHLPTDNDDDDDGTFPSLERFMDEMGEFSPGFIEGSQTSLHFDVYDL
jgi:hypothetical protein